MNLLEIMYQVVRMRDSNTVLTEEVSRNMAQSLTYFNIEAIDKYIRGQAEHGGDIRDRNLMKELAMESLDSFWYGPIGAMGWPPKPSTITTTAEGENK